MTLQLPFRRRVVLCVDDDVEELRIRKAVLETRGYEVFSQTSGRAALLLLKDLTVDAVVLDYDMPEMDGAAVAAEIRKDCPRLPIIVHSGHDISELPDWCRVLINGFVQKGSAPLELSLLLDKVTGALPEAA